MGRKQKNRSKNSVELLAHNFPRMSVTEQYRLIRTNILYAAVDKEIKSIMVTSPEQGEGKSTTATNLAIVLAQQGKKVLLVDTDLRKPSLHHVFNISNHIGLTSALSKEIYLDEAITKTYIPHLDVLTSGPIPLNPSELLNSNSMKVLMKEMYSDYHFIVFDTPPALAVTDAQVLANQCDGVVLVISSRKTLKNAAIEAKELLEKAHSQLLGVVLNRMERKRSSWKYQV
ncbi:CpsD/CapB family tyrosine-protein kinase [Robertmurraya sp. Marseille-Q9965]